MTKSHSSALFRTHIANAILTPLDLLELARHKPIHFMGIGGAGMSPLAELVHRSGGQVSGCDANPGGSAEALQALGVPVESGHDSAHVDGRGALVITSAVRADHPELLAARAAGIPVLKRAEALGAIVNRGTVVGVSGTHGKTTTTALSAAVLAAGGLNPTALVGGHVSGWGGNLRLGTDRLFIVEADEYDRSFLTLRPSIAVVTTLEADHLDIYGTLAGVEEAFDAFLGHVVEGGLVVGCADDLGVGRLLARGGAGERRVRTYGLGPGSMLRAEDVRAEGVDTRFAVRAEGRLLGEARIRVPGLHNVRNGLAAIAVGLEMGVSWDQVVEGLAAYQGVQRRFERVGEAGGVTVVDDYAHHPTEVEATLSAARAAFPDRRVVAVFQPHLYSRTRDFAREFGIALSRADVTVITGIYAAREAPIPGVTSELIVEQLRAAGGEVVYVPDRVEVEEVVVDLLAPGDLCLTLGAGDLDRAARAVVERLATSGSESGRAR